MQPTSLRTFWLDRGFSKQAICAPTKLHLRARLRLLGITNATWLAAAAWTVGYGWHGLVSLRDASVPEMPWPERCPDIWAEPRWEQN